MKILLTTLILTSLFVSCKKDSNKIASNASSLCADTAFLQTNIAEPLQSIFFFNGKDGFVSGYNGGLYKTIDSAKSWTKLNSTINLPIYSIFFLDSMNGFAAGGESSCGGTGCVIPGGFVLRTNDAGANWTKIYNPTAKEKITSIYFISMLTGFCIAGNTIFRTLDGGNTWTEQQIDNPGGIMMQIVFANSKKGYVACLSGKIIKTENGGNTWEVINPNINRGYYTLTEANGSIYVGGQEKIIKSTDEGHSWCALANSPSDIYAIYFSDEKNGFAFGRGNYSGGDFGLTYGSIYCTNDGGISWGGTADIKETNIIQSVSFPTAHIAYAISSNKFIKLSF